MNPAELRGRVLKQLRDLEFQQRQVMSQAVCQRAIAFFQMNTPFLKDQTIGVYRALSDELQLESLIDFLSHHGARLYYPKILNADMKQMAFYSADFGFEKNALGIWEPSSPGEGIEPESLDAIVVPGVAWGFQGERIGRGAGYYDRFLSRVHHQRRLALAFDIQVFDRLPQTLEDQGVHWLFTETQSRVCPVPFQELNP